MYIKDGIAYAGDPSPAIRAISVRPLEDYSLWVRFTTGETKLFDFAPLLDCPAFLPLKDKSVFDGAYIDYGCVVWDDGNIDIAPEHLYEHGVTVGEVVQHGK